MSLIGIGVNVIVTAHRKVLLGLRRHSRGNGTWAVPGGRVLYGQSPAEAAARVLFEETGIRVERLDPFAPVPWNDIRFPIEDRQHITLFFRAHPVTDQAVVTDPEKYRRWEWFDTNALPNPLFPIIATAEMLDALKTLSDDTERK